MVVRNYGAYSFYLVTRDLVSEAQGFQSYHINIWKLTSRREGTGMGRKRKWQRTGFGVMLDHYRVLQSVADEYDLKMLQIERENGVFRINTSQGWKKFKPFKYSAPELEFVHSALEHLAAKGWKRSLPLHLTKEGATHVETPYGLFYVTIWVQGTEIDPEDPFQLEASVKILGEMHRLLEDFRSETECHRLYPVSWHEKYRRQGEDLLRYQQLAEDTRKNKFSRRFRQVADDFLRMIGIGLQLLEDGDYERVSKEPDLNTICHTSPIASNLVAGHDGKIYMIDFDNARRDLRIYDVARMMIRHGDWDVDKALFILRNYQEANPLTKEEIALIPALCALSNRGWQVARSFYERERPYLGRLETAIDEMAKQDAFVKALVKIQPADLVYRPQQIFQTIPYPEDLTSSETPLEIPIIVDETIDSIGGDEPEFVTSPVVDREPFYWGDADVEVPEVEGDFAGVGLMEMGLRMAQLAQQLDHMMDAMHGMDLVDQSGFVEQTSSVSRERDMQDGLGKDLEDELLDISIKEGLEISVERPEVTDGKSLVIPTLATGEAQEPVLGAETEVYVALDYLGCHDQREGEVRLNIAADMEDVSKKVSMETSVFAEEEYLGFDATMGEDIPVWATQHDAGEDIDIGVEVPVVYSDGLESGDDEALAEQYIRSEGNDEIIGQEVSWHQADQIANIDTQQSAPHHTQYISVEDLPVMGNLDSVADTAQVMHDQDLETTSNLNVTDASTQELGSDDLATGIGPDGADDSVVEAGSGDLPAHRDEKETDLSVKSDGEAVVQEQPWEPGVAAGSRPMPSSDGVVQWGDFPEPLGRRRGRGRRTV